MNTNPLKTIVTGITFDSPVILASGYITETPEFFLRSIRHNCAGMVTRSLKKHSRGEVTAPRYYVAPKAAFMLNAEWGNEYSWTFWRDVWATEVTKTGKPLVLSLSGRNIAECLDLITAFNTLPIAAYEINVSCAHSGFLHGDLNVNLSHLQELVTSACRISEKPVWIKLGYSSFIVEMAKVAEECGAAAIVTTNTIGPGLIIDTKTTKPVLGIQGGRGGISGRAIFPIALQCVWTLCQSLTIPVIGSGGVATSDDTLQMLMAGASLVQLYTEPALKGPRVFSKISQGLKEYCRSHCTTIRETIGCALPWANAAHSFTAKPPHIIQDDCTGCGWCKPACAFNAISFKKTAGYERAIAVIGENCITCNACVGICPEVCIVHHVQMEERPNDPS